MDSSWKQIVSKEKDYSLALFLCYLIRYCHRKYSRFTVGRKLICSKRFDDVLLEFEHEQKRTVLMFDIKQHRYRRWNSVTFVDNLLGCFKEYLKLRDSINTSTHKLIVWITDFTSKDDNLKSYQPTDDICDLLDSIEPSMGKYKLRKGSELEIELLKRVDPFYEVAERISRLLLKEGRITPFAIPQKIYDILLKNVFTENSFREDFILGNSPLPPEVKRFRENLECLLAQLLKHRNVHQFRLAKIGDHLPLMRFDFLKSVSVEASDELQKVESAASFEDIDKFFSLLIFYVCSSTVSDVRKLLKQKLDVEEQRELLQFQKVGSQLVEANVKQIFKWIDLKKQCTFELNDLLQFKGESLRPLKLVLSEYIREAKFNTLYISTCVDNNITLNRIMHLLKQYNYSDRVVIANKHSLHQAMDLIDIVNSVTPLMNNLPILILVGEDLTLSSSECLKVQNLNFLQIYVECGNKLGVGEDFCDRFRFSDLLDVIQNRLLMKPILLQEREVRLKNLLAKTCFEHISADELLDWAACYRPSIGSGEFPSLPKHFIQRNLFDDFCEAIDLIADSFDRLTIICGTAGVGKSVELSRIARSFHDRYREHVTILVNFKDIIHLFPSKKGPLDIIMKLIDNKKLNYFQVYVIKNMLDQRRIFFLLDGLEEVSKLKEENIKNIIKWISLVPFTRVIIAIRPHQLALITENQSKFAIIQLNPFTESEQLKFFKNYWGNSSLSEGQVRDIIQLFGSEHNLLENPLHASIVAAILEEQALNDLKNINFSTLASILEAFIDKRFQIFASKSFDLFSHAHVVILQTLRANFETKHELLAFRLLTNDTIDNNDYIEMEQYGLLQFENNSISFIHPFFHELFFAQYILKQHINQECFNKLMADRFCKPTYRRFNVFLDHQVAKVNLDQTLLTEPASFGAIDFNDLNPGNNFTLSQHKTKQIYAFFKWTCSTDQLHDYIRTSIAEDLLNTFEVIYDCLPVSFVKTVRFGFDSIACSVDLSAIDEDRIVRLLDIFNKKLPNDFIERVITNFSPDQSDFITVAIKQNYPRVIKALFTIEQHLFDEDESDRFSDYSALRWRQYLQMAIVHERINLLNIVFDGIDRRFHPRVTKYFLMEENIMHALVEACREAEETALETVQRILRFVQEHLSLTDIEHLVEEECGSITCAELLANVKNSAVRGLISSAIYPR